MKNENLLKRYIFSFFNGNVWGKLSQVLDTNLATLDFGQKRNILRVLYTEFAGERNAPALLHLVPALIHLHIIPAILSNDELIILAKIKAAISNQFNFPFVKHETILYSLDFIQEGELGPAIGNNVERPAIENNVERPVTPSDLPTISLHTRRRTSSPQDFLSE